MSTVSEHYELPSAEEARRLVVLKSIIFGIVISYIDGKIMGAIKAGKFSWKSSSDNEIDNFIREKVNVEDENGKVKEKYVLSKNVFGDFSISEWFKILLPYGRERYESKGYKVTISEDYVLEISF